MEQTAELAANAEHSLTASITNFSKKPFKGYTDKYFGHTDFFNMTVNNAPSASLEAMDGQTKMVASQNTLAFAGASEYTIWLKYIAEDNSTAFGVEMQVRFQVAGIGAGPRWRIFKHFGGKLTWGDYNDHATPFSFQEGGVNIAFTPTIGHSNIEVDIQITDA